MELFSTNRAASFFKGANLFHGPDPDLSYAVSTFSLNQAAGTHAHSIHTHAKQHVTKSLGSTSDPGFDAL